MTVASLPLNTSRLPLVKAHAQILQLGWMVATSLVLCLYLGRTEAIASSSLPAIQARTYPLQVVRRSNSNRIYLFEDTNRALPSVGKVLLLKRDSEPVMAFRVLRPYPEQNYFAARRLRRYGENYRLPNGESYLAIEKVGEVGTVTLNSIDQKDLTELEGNTSSGGSSAPTPAISGNLPEAAPYDPELDAGTTPPPQGSVDSEAADQSIPAELNSELDQLENITIEEMVPIYRYTHSFSLEAAMFRTYGYDSGYIFATGMGFRYGLTFGRMMLLKSPTVQDSIRAELGLAYYRVTDYGTSGNLLDVLPISTHIRYQIHLGPNLGLSIYSGGVFNQVVASAGADDQAKSNLSTFVPAGGLGAFFVLAPHWVAKADFGFDRVGLMLGMEF